LGLTPTILDDALILRGKPASERERAARQRGLARV